MTTRVNLYTALNPARFTSNALSGFSLKEINALLNTNSLAAKTPDLKKQMENLIGFNSDFYASERTLLTDARDALKTGVTATGKSYEEMAIPKGTSVTYYQTHIELAPKGGTAIRVPNFPVPLPPKIDPVEGQEFADPWVIANFDIVKGNVKAIRSLLDLEDIWGGEYSSIRCSGLTAVASQVVNICKTSKRWESIQTEEETLSGNAFADFWTSTVTEVEYEYRLVLHSAILLCLKQVSFRKDTKQLVVTDIATPAGGTEKPYEDSIFHVVSPQQLAGQELDQAKIFVKETGHCPIFLVGAVQSRIKFTASAGADSVQGVLAHARMMKTFGSKKRGLSKIAASFNFAPRMSSMWREVNFVVAAIGTLVCDMQLRVSSGAFSVVLSYLILAAPSNVKILITLDQMQLISGLLPSDLEYITQVRDERFPIVYYDRRCSVPTVDGSKPEEADRLLTRAYNQWKKMQPTGPLFVYTAIFSEGFFQDGAVLTFGSQHDLKAVFTNLDFTTPAVLATMKLAVSYPPDFFPKAVLDMRRMITWWHAPQKIYSPLGNAYKPVPGTLKWSEDGGFELNAEYRFNEVTHLEGRVVGGGEWAAIGDNVPVASTTTTTTTVMSTATASVGTQTLTPAVPVGTPTREVRGATSVTQGEAVFSVPPEPAPRTSTVGKADDWG